MTLQAGRSRRDPIRDASEGAMLRLMGPASALSGEERTLLRRLHRFREMFSAGQVINEEGEPPPAQIIVEGWACRQRLLPGGGRQIIDFLLPGDAIALADPIRPLDLESTVALTRVESMDAVLLREIFALNDGRHDVLKQLFAAGRRREETRLIDRLVRLGSSSAQARMAHLLIELRDRQRWIGLATGDSLQMPITHEQLGDALGLSVVHVSRTLTALKAERLISVRSGWITLLDEDRLTAIGGYRAGQPRLH